MLQRMGTHADATALGISHGAVRTRLHWLNTDARRLLSALDGEPLIDDLADERVLAYYAAALAGAHPCRSNIKAWTS